MPLPFTSAQFHAVFRAYNEAVWPMQLVLLALGVSAFGLVFLRRPRSGLAISMILAALWAWIAVAYHVAFFAAINPLAWVFAAVSLAGAAVFLWQGVIRRRLKFRWRGGARDVAGAALIVFSLLVYPWWSTRAGLAWPTLPTFGLPCPTTLFTIGLLAFAVRPSPRSVLVVPLLWCLVGAQAAFVLGVRADLSLAVAGVFAVVLMVRRGGSEGGGWVAAGDGKK